MTIPDDSQPTTDALRVDPPPTCSTSSAEEPCENCGGLRYIQDAGFACCSVCNPGNLRYEKPISSIKITGRLVEAGDDDNGTPRIIFETTREDLAKAGALPLYMVGATLEISW